MIYLDHAATSFHKPPSVVAAVTEAMRLCASPGRGGYPAAMRGAQRVFACRELAAKLFDCAPEQVVFTGNCTEGLNAAIRTLVRSGDRVVVTGFEHNAVIRPLHGLGAEILVAGSELFDNSRMLECFEAALRKKPAAAVFTHVSNVFGYILPVEAMAELCKKYGVPFILDAAQSAGILPVSLQKSGAAFIAMPGHKALLGPQGTGILLCGMEPQPLLYGGTGSDSRSMDMPRWLPDRGEAGTLNVPGICGLHAGLSYLNQVGIATVGKRDAELGRYCASALQGKGIRVFAGTDQTGVVSFLPEGDCEMIAQMLADRGFAVRAGLHCAPLAHDSAGTLATGTVRLSFGYGSRKEHVDRFVKNLINLPGRTKKI